MISKFEKFLVILQTFHFDGSLLFFFMAAVAALISLVRMLYVFILLLPAS